MRHRQFCDAFHHLTRSNTEAEYEARRDRLHELCPQEARYIDEIWLDIWKRRLVRCWTSQILTFGVQSTSRVEDYHAGLKKWLCSSQGDMVTVFDRMMCWWDVSIAEHLTAVTEDTIKCPRRLQTPLYSNVVRVIHKFALLQCESERKKPVVQE
ncbi:TPA: hypothetical protein N0F65_008545 [Lagenidium giganteum]|uniref:Uncharacterized protein n=1 Tax=Lagenidium giganteum TaxID=4803 RepID=A0AAV2YQV0_9STRA|nr:TPA: hypothetical protein N0F65_008545 [Lagenidium giganteum]